MARSIISNRLRAIGSIGVEKCQLSSGDGKQRPIDLVRFVLLHALAGMALGVATAGLLLLVNAAGLRALIWSSNDALTPIIMLLAGFGITIGGLYVASAVMLITSNN